MRRCLWSSFGSNIKLPRKKVLSGEQFRVKHEKPAKKGAFQCLFLGSKFVVFKVSSL